MAMWETSIYIFENMRHVVVKFTSRWGVCAGATVSRQANNMSFQSQFHCFIGAYRENMEQGAQQQLLVQTPNNR